MKISELQQLQQQQSATQKPPISLLAGTHSTGCETESELQLGARTNVVGGKLDSNVNPMGEVT